MIFQVAAKVWVFICFLYYLKSILDPIGNKPFGFHGLSRLQCNINNMFNITLDNDHFIIEILLGNVSMLFVINVSLYLVSATYDNHYIL